MKICITKNKTIIKNIQNKKRDNNNKYNEIFIQGKNVFLLNRKILWVYSEIENKMKRCLIVERINIQGITNFFITLLKGIRK
jgi:hypothetical protein